MPIFMGRGTLDLKKGISHDTNHVAQKHAATFANDCLS